MTATSTFHVTADRYADWRHVASGGSAEVWRVLDRDLGVELAIKLLRPELTSDSRQIDAMRREVLISRALRHPNICPIHDLYEGPRGIGIVMDLLPGQDLKDWMAAHRGRLLDTLPDRLALLRRLADALAVAHQRIIHRDIKPANIFLRGGSIREPLVMDFGLSVLGSAAEQGFVGGTPKYMAPEQYLAPGTVDQRSDLFSLGVLAYELLTDGQIPQNSLRDVLRTGVVPPMPAGGLTPPSRHCDSIPPALDRLVLSLLDSDPAGRPRSAREVLDILDAVQLSSGVPTKRGAGPATAGAVAVPAGSYEVGTSRMGASLSERPRRRVRLSAYLIAPHPVTSEEYDAFVAATGHRRPGTVGGAQARRDAPVVDVNWAEASAYAAWIGGRLPTEIEWEVAARAGNPDAEYPWGAQPPLGTQANIDRACPCPTPVGSYPTGRNRWGLWDMCGNVWEWCADPWEEQLHRRLVSDAENPLGRGGGELRSMRGGSFDSFAGMGRCGFRGKESAGQRRGDVGFRVAFGGGPTDGT